MPYAMRLSGWLGLGALVLAAALFCLSGKLIVRGFDRIPPGRPHSYSQLGASAC
jgi:amino acid permease